MWQAYVHHEDALGFFTTTKVGKPRHSRKEARLEARRLGQSILDTWVHPSWGITVPEVPSVNVIVKIPRVEGMYGYKDDKPLAYMGVRWQPEE
jgi:hypothetical protein